MDSVASAGNNLMESSPTASASQPRAPAPRSAGLIALSRFVVANAVEAEVKAAFRAGSRHVDHAAGFVRREVLCPFDRPREIRLGPDWRCADDYRAWHRGHDNRELPRDSPHGLKPVGRQTCIREFEIVCD